LIDYPTTIPRPFHTHSMLPGRVASRPAGSRTRERRPPAPRQSGTPADCFRTGAPRTALERGAQTMNSLSENRPSFRAMRSGWSTDISLLEATCLVIKASSRAAPR
jgi:hypothetical protein